MPSPSESLSRTPLPWLPSFLLASQSGKTKQGRDFCPFLAIVERTGGERAAWLTYFHVVTDPTTKKVVSKYGQWAPFIVLGLVDDLLAQAREGGYLLKQSTLNAT